MLERLAKVLSILFCVMSAQVPSAAHAETCKPFSISSDYLVTDTAYGHLLGNIDPSTYAQGECDSTSTKFTFCLKNPVGSTPSCSKIQMDVGSTKRLGELTRNQNILGKNNELADLPLTVKIMQEGTDHVGDMCLLMPTSRGMKPISCKGSILILTQGTGNDEPDTCSPLGQSCYNGHAKSQSLFNFSGVAAHCLKETLDSTFYEKPTCSGSTSSIENLVPFVEFQDGMKKVIGAALIIYVIFYGFNVVLNHQYLELNKVATFLLKFLFVLYFSIGLGPLSIKDGVESQKNGIVEYGLPILSQAAPEFAQIVFNAAGSKGLCSFDSSKYQKGYEFFGIWDAIDCRLGYYLGVSLLYNDSDIIRSLSNNNSGTDSPGLELGFPGKEVIDVLKSPLVFRFFVVLFGFLMGGNLLVILSGLIFAIIFISLILNFITSYLVCLVTLYVMAYISPIFVPMALFEKTKGYFDSWLRICISCTLQPAVLAGFVALLLTIYDSAIYKNCEFERHDYSVSDVNFSTFEIKLPAADQQECKSSAGYKLLKHYIGQGWEKYNVILFPIYAVKDVFGLSVSLLYVLVFTVIFYFFSSSINSFASELTGGPALGAMVAAPSKIIDAATSAASFIKSAMEARSGRGTSRSPSGGSAAPARTNPAAAAQDKISTSGKE